MQSRKNENTVSRYFPLAILASRLLENTKSPSRSQMKFPLLFSAPIPNIATKISQIPHPAKPIVDPQNLLRQISELLIALRKCLLTLFCTLNDISVPPKTIGTKSFCYESPL